MHGNMDLIHPAALLSAVIVDADETALELSSAAVHVTVSGTGFTYANNQLAGGVAQGLSFSFGLDTATPMSFGVSYASFPATSLLTWVLNDDAVGALSTILAGNDLISAGRAH